MAFFAWLAKLLPNGPPWHPYAKALAQGSSNNVLELRLRQEAQQVFKFIGCPMMKIFASFSDRALLMLAHKASWHMCLGSQWWAPQIRMKGYLISLSFKYTSGHSTQWSNLTMPFWDAVLHDPQTSLDFSP